MFDETLDENIIVRWGVVALAIFALALNAPFGVLLAVLSRTLLTKRTRVAIYGRFAEYVPLKVSMVIAFASTFGAVCAIILAGNASQQEALRLDAQRTQIAALQGQVSEYRASEGSRAKFLKERSAIVKEIDADLSGGKISDAKEVLKLYAPYADYLDDARIRVDIAASKVIVNDANASLREKVNAYNQLSSLVPSDGSIQAQRQHYSQMLEQEESAEAQHEAEVKAKRDAKDRLDGQISAWDGSNRYVEKAIKKVLNDPDSYQHVETRYTVQGDVMTVLTKFRAKNGFGGVITQSAIAKVDSLGNVLSLDFVQ